MVAPLVLLAVVAGAHAGFQVTVTAMVYPRLAATTASEWDAVHGAHSRRIAPLVVVLYGGLVVAGAWAAYDGAGGVALWVALATAAATVVLTAVRAAPLHGRLGRTGPDPALLAALLRVDRWRAVLALVALGAAVAALVVVG
ncbi:hypothetical protein GCM10009623_11560 [Nocardioides aestuarii]|uniref:DUF1772 domain-containing protein n=1 Tax=Nocardioides aestuarii TaxID=252231 RepID=A0ABW4TIT3_9ACTN